MAGSLDDTFGARFKPLLAQGLLTVTNFREVLKYDVMMQGQVCPLRTLGPLLCPFLSCVRLMGSPWVPEGGSCMGPA